MKKILFSLMAAIMIFATSCENDLELGATGKTSVVSFSVESPEMASRAYSDGLSATKLQYAVYEGEEILPALTELNATIEGKTTVNLQLTTGNTYTVIFWAAAPDAPYSVDFENKTMTVDYSTDKKASNDEKRDAFYAKKTFTVTGSQTETIELRRPFAQLNIGTADYADAKRAGYEPKYSGVKVKNVYTTLNLWDGGVDGATEVMFDYAAIPVGEEFPVSGYEYMSMNYLLVASTKALVDIEFGYTETDASAAMTRIVGSVPVQRNYRTNIFGQLLTSDVAVNVVIDPIYEEPDNNVGVPYVTIGNEIYESFAAAFAAAQDGATLVLQGESVLKATANQSLFKVEKNITIDLNGNALVGQIPDVTKNTAVFEVVEGGSLTIQGEGDVRVVTAKAPDVLAAMINNNGGVVNLKGGNWTMVALDYPDALIPTFVDNNSNVNDATLNIYGGTYTFHRNLFRNFANAASHNGYATVATINIYGGTFNGRADDAGAIWNQKPSASTPAGAGVINVMGGTFNNVEINDEFAGVITANTASELQNILNNAEEDVTVFFGADITGDVVITQKEGIDVTVFGNGKKFNGVMTVFGNGRQNGSETLTIKEINFVAKNGANACILSPDRAVNNKYSYAHNVTVENCTFTDEDGTVNCAAIRHQDGGDKNWTVKGCTVLSGMHSILQVNNVEGSLAIEDCKVYSKNGANLNSTTKVAMNECEFDVTGYAVRFGVNTGGNPGTPKAFAINNSTLKSANGDGDAVIIFRASAVDATLTLTNTTLVGNPEISGATSATTIVRN